MQAFNLLVNLGGRLNWEAMSVIFQPGDSLPLHPLILHGLFLLPAWLHSLPHTPFLRASKLCGPECEWRTEAWDRQSAMAL